MPTLTERKPENIVGRFYVDVTCIDCDFCRTEAAAFFRRDSESGQSYVYHQPITVEDVALAQEALRVMPE